MLNAVFGHIAIHDSHSCRPQTVALENAALRRQLAILIQDPLHPKPIVNLKEMAVNPVR
jgi:hypothetical protein